MDDRDFLRERLGANTPKTGHQQKGRRFDPPLVASTKIQPTDWERDRLPDLLWIGCVAGIEGNPGVALDALAAVDAAVPAEVSVELDGLISSFGLVPHEHRDVVRRALQEAAPQTLSGFVADVLLLFPEGPAAWLVEGQEVTNPRDEVLDYLRLYLLHAYDAKDDLATRLRAVVVARRIHNDRLNIHRPAAQIAAVAHGNNIAEHASTIRGAHNIGVMDRDGGGWQRYFWNTAYGLAPCRLDEHGENAAGHLAVPDALGALSKALCDLVDEAGSTLREMRNEIVVDAYDPIPDEVRLGLASRAFRLARTLVADPGSWRTDRVTELLRQLVECQITTAWILQQPDETLHAYKEYGLGRIKLWKLNVEEQIEARTEGNDGSAREDGNEMLFALHELLREEVNAGLSEEFLGVDLGANSTGTNLRQMARDVGLENTHKMAYQPLSGGAHGDWYSLKGSDLVMCEEVLHRFHNMPRMGVKRRPFLQNVPLGGLLAAQEAITNVFAHYGLDAPNMLEPANKIVSEAVEQQRHRVASRGTA